MVLAENLTISCYSNMILDEDKMDKGFFFGLMQFELCISQILNKKLEEITFYLCIYALHLFCYELLHDDFLNSLLQLHIGQINVWFFLLLTLAEI